MQLSDFWNNLVHCQVYIIDPWAAPFSSYLKTVVSVICTGMQQFPSIGRCMFGPCFVCAGQSCPCHLRLCVMVWTAVRAEVAVEVLAIGKLAGKLSRPGLGSFGLNDWKIFFFFLSFLMPEFSLLWNPSFMAYKSGKKSFWFINLSCQTLWSAY